MNPGLGDEMGVECLLPRVRTDRRIRQWNMRVTSNKYCDSRSLCTQLVELVWTSVPVLRFQLRWIIGYWVSCLIYTNEETPTFFEYNKIDNRSLTWSVRSHTQEREVKTENKTRKIKRKGGGDSKLTAVKWAINKEGWREIRKNVGMGLESPIACLGWKLGTDVLEHHTRSKLDCLTIADWTDMLSQTVSNRLSTYVPQRRKRTTTFTTPIWRSKMYTTKYVFFCRLTTSVFGL
jgi:hypothetical protein